MRVKGRKDNSRLERDTSPSLLLDTTLVVATLDAEVTLLTPGSIPRVGAKPVLDTTFLTIAHQLDGVTTLKAAAGVVIDTRRIAHEILINLEGNLEGTVGGKLGLHVLLTHDGVGLLALALVGIPVEGSVASALLLALRSDHAAGVVASAVRIAILRHDTSLDPVGPGASRLTTVAGTAVGDEAHGAAVHILSRKTDDLVLVDALTIAHGLDGTESPAGTTVLLVADVVHGGARGPLGARIEGGRGSSDLSSSELLLPPVVGAEVLQVDTKKATSLTLGHASDGVVSSLPHSLLGIDLTDELGAHGDLLSEGHRGNKSNSNDELHIRLCN